MIRIKKRWVILSFVAASFNVSAQEKDSTSIDLDSVQVSSTRTIQNITRTGRNVQVFSKKQIEALPVNSTDELIRLLPGVETQSRGAFGVQSDFSLRGSTFNQVLILIDGTRFNDPLTGHFNGYIPVPLAEIERVEVIKGTASSIYGADAVGGVINIVTKNSPDSDNLDVLASIKGGENGYFGSDVSALYKVKKWKFGIGVQTNKSDGESFKNPNVETVASAPETYNTWFENNTFSFSAMREMGENSKLSIRSSYDERDFNAKYFYTTSVYDESVERTAILFNDLKWITEKGKFKTELDLVYRQSEDFFEFNPAFTANTHMTRYGFFQANQSFVKSNKSTFVYGLQADVRSIESNDRGDHTNYHAGVYGQWIGKLTSRFTSSVSLRADYDDNYEFALSPQVNLSYVVNKWVLRGGVGKGTRAADYTERFVSTNLAKLSPGRNLGNPDLSFESSWSYEAGIDYYVSNGFKIVTTGFYRVADDLIDYIPTPGNEITNVDVSLDSLGNYMYASNLSKVNTAGLEVEVWYSKKFSSGVSLNTQLGYTLLESDNPDGEVSKYVSSHAKHLFNGNITAAYKRFDLQISGLYKDRDDAYSKALDVALSKSYFVSNLKAGVYFLDKRVKVTGEVLNLLDESYSDILGATMPGRWFIGGVTIKL